MSDNVFIDVVEPIDYHVLAPTEKELELARFAEIKVQFARAAGKAKLTTPRDNGVTTVYADDVVLHYTDGGARPAPVAAQRLYSPACLPRLTTLTCPPAAARSPRLARRGTLVALARLCCSRRPFGF